MTTKKTKPPSKGIRTHIILMRRTKSQDTKFAGYAIDGSVKRGDKTIPVEEHVEILNKSKTGNKFFFEKINR